MQFIKIKNLVYIFFFLFLICNNANAHIDHYKNLKKLNFEIYRNNKLVGNHIYQFTNNGNQLKVESKINFQIKKLGVVLYNYSATGIEIYENNKLVSFKSNTIQNKKNKYCNIKIDSENYIIEGSSYKGEAPEKFILGTWWNHEIINFNNQISAISGRIIPQNVSFLGKETLNIKNKKYNTLHFNFSSKDKKLDKKKKLNTDVWYDEKTLIWLKASFEKSGKWEYKLIELESF